jgi:uncharacterized protein YndB with AHSA1/START domain
MSQQEPFKPQVSDEAVQAKTGRGWSEWLSLLDEAGAAQMSHPEIVAYLNSHFSIEPWWQQTVTVTYEQARGLRQKHETSEGFQISASKTIGAPIGKAFSAWNDVKSRQAWLGDAALQIRKATADKSIRITWEQGPEKGTSVEVYLYAKGQDKCQVAVNHTKLRSAAAGEKMKKYWSARLEALKELLEG